MRLSFSHNQQLCERFFTIIFVEFYIIISYFLINVNRNQKNSHKIQEKIGANEILSRH